MNRSSLIIAVFTVLFMVRVVVSTRRHRLPEQHALLWLGVSALVLVFAVWREGIELLARTVGIYDPPLVLLLGATAGLGALVHHQSEQLAVQRQQLQQVVSELAVLRADPPPKKSP